MILRFLVFNFIDMQLKKFVFLLSWLLMLSLKPMPETGEHLWLRYATLPKDIRSEYVSFSKVYFLDDGDTEKVALEELSLAFKGLIGVDGRLQNKPAKSKLLIGKNLHQIVNENTGT